MYERSGSSPFKYVFWGILLLCAIGLMGQAGWFLFGGFRAWSHIFGIDPGQIEIGRPLFVPRFFLMSLLPTITVGAIWIAVVAPLVYRDAKRRGLDPGCGRQSPPSSRSSSASSST